jgi:two-component system OmpR family sensor kinase
VGRLFWKFFLAFWLALLTAGVTVGTVVWLHTRDRDTAARDLAMGPPAEFLVRAASATLEHGGLPALRELLARMSDDPMARLYVVDEAGRELLGRAYPRAALERARELVRSGIRPPVARSLAAGDGHVYLLFAAEAEGRLLEGRLFPRRPGPPGASPGEAGPRPPAGPPGPPPPLLPILAGLFASLAFSALLAWYLAKPIRNLRGAFADAARGNLDVRVAPMMGRRRDELADLGRDFDHMAGRLRDLMDAQRRLLHDVSHEIRSPLARLQAAIGLARQRPETREAGLDRIEREAQRLDEMVGELLTLSRLEAGMADNQQETADLAELLGMVVEDARFEAEVSGRKVNYAATGPAPIRCRAELLHRAIENVVRNALKFSPEGATVEVNAGPVGPGMAGVTVADRGPGVPEPDLEAIFVPFYRSEASANTRGFGLGLAIAKRAVEAHGGTIHAANRGGGGLVVTMHLPTAPATGSRSRRVG